MHQPILLLSVLALLTLPACTSMISRDHLPYPLTSEQFSEQVKVVTLPLPVIATSPNEGPTYGALTSFLLHDSRNEVSTLIAPQVNFNKYFGTTVQVYGALYPTPDQSIEINLSQSTRVNKD